MTKPRTFYYYYGERDSNTPVIRIKGKRQPGPNTIPWGGTWVLQEYICNPVEGAHYQNREGALSCAWQTPCFPEITWGRLKQMKFIRKEPVTLGNR